MTFHSPLLLAAAVAVATSVPVHASDPRDCPADDNTRRAPAQRVVVDPRTGAITAVPAAPAALAAPAAPVTSEPLVGARLASGAVRVDLKGRYQMAVVAHRDATGAIKMSCERAGAQAPPSPKTTESGEVSHAN